MKKLAIVGSTGSIGTQTLEVLEQFPGQYEIVALSAGSNLDLLEQQVRHFKPRYVAIGKTELYDELKSRLADLNLELRCGIEGICELAALPEVDIVVSAIVGAVGIQPTIAAMKAGKRIALANKETLVAAGSLIMPHLAENGAEIIPVDSEHSAIFQCLEGRSPEQVERIILTASGGPFRNAKRENLADVTVQDALNHPNWSMGGKITIDSATMFNKGLEVMEAHWLFNMDYDHISVVIHPESIVHSMVELVDGAVIAQLGMCDMKLPIQLALTYPRRDKMIFPKLNMAAAHDLHFREVDNELFPAVELAYAAGRCGGTAPAAINGANEEAVAAFLNGKIKFTEIIDIVTAIFGYHQQENFTNNPDLSEILAVDGWARQRAAELVLKRRK